MMHKCKATIAGRVGNLTITNQGTDRMSVRVSLFVDKQDAQENRVQESWSVTLFKAAAKHAQRMLRKGDTVCIEDCYMSQSTKDGVTYTNFQCSAIQALTIEPKEASDIMKARWNDTTVPNVGKVTNPNTDLDSAYNASEPTHPLEQAQQRMQFTPNDLGDDLPF